MRAVMHQDCKPELARADDADGEQIGQRIGPPRHQRDGAEDERPGMGDQADPLPGEALPHGNQFVFAKEITGTHAEGRHDQISSSDLVAAPSSPTRRSFAPGGLAVACGPTTRSNSPVRSCGERPMANPSTITPIATAQNCREVASGSHTLLQPCRSTCPAN